MGSDFRLLLLQSRIEKAVTLIAVVKPFIDGEKLEVWFLTRKFHSEYLKRPYWPFQFG